ncbi:glycoside hydrolase family 25 protein [Actinocorallia longicatena]|uniref:Lysozyme n=1 Tax=Actinocorallia longicatena TaxID=111803 RepID=A0ABP6QPP7_9ACTN
MITLNRKIALAVATTGAAAAVAGAALAGPGDATAVTSTAASAKAEPRAADAEPEKTTKAAPGALPYGVDVSHYDRNYDWSQKKLAFGIAKATEGTVGKDETFAANWAKIRENGLVRGAYHYGRPKNDPVKEADHFLRTVRAAGLQRGDLLMLDLETTDGRSRGRVNAWARTWLERVEAGTGVKPVFYSGYHFAREHGEGLGGYPLWVAHYGKKAGRLAPPAPWKEWAIHQYSSTDHDNNVSALTPDALRALGYQG